MELKRTKSHSGKNSLYTAVSLNLPSCADRYAVGSMPNLQVSSRSIAKARRLQTQVLQAINA